MLGVRDLTYRMAFLACAVVPTAARVSDCVLVVMLVTVC